jgi:hypothetical protein
MLIWVRATQLRPYFNDSVTRLVHLVGFRLSSAIRQVPGYMNLLRITRLIHSVQRHVTRQKILNWRQSLQFPSRPRVSREGIDLMKQLLCEPEDRLGSQAVSSPSRPNSIIVQARRSGFMVPSPSAVDDGATLIKVRITAPPSALCCLFHP